jgi:Zn-dependent M28 family amino/carboxypeptidase
VRQRIAAIVLAAASLAPLQTASQTASRRVDRAQLMRDVTALASSGFLGRQAGRPGGLKARQWVVEQFRTIGLPPLGTNGYVQLFAFAEGGVQYLGGNVVGRIEGRRPAARLIVVTAHYDHLGIREGRIHPGADDNASGVAALLAVARHFTLNPPNHPMLFAALDAEEGGRARENGAKSLVSSLSIAGIALNVNLDMVSRSDVNEIYAAGTYHTPGLRPILEEVRSRASVTLLFGHDRPPAAGGGQEDWTFESDHGEFHKAGVPFVYFGVEDHADYHTPTDTADKIDPRFYGDVVDTIIDAVLTLDTRLE